MQRECYNSYFYRVEDEMENPLEKFELHGEKITRYLDGGSALHFNLDENLTQKQYQKLIELAAVTGCNYFCTNVKITICNDCNHIDKQTRTECPKCHSKNIDHATRVIGYLKRITSFGSGRRAEHQRRKYHVLNQNRYSEKSNHFESISSNSV